MGALVRPWEALASVEPLGPSCGAFRAPVGTAAWADSACGARSFRGAGSKGAPLVSSLQHPRGQQVRLRHLPRHKYTNVNGSDAVGVEPGVDELSADVRNKAPATHAAASTNPAHDPASPDS